MGGGVIVVHLLSHILSSHLFLVYLHHATLQPSSCLGLRGSSAL
jgi:hypothetical protein